MTDITRGKDVGGSTGAGNDGSFASKGQTAAGVSLDMPVAPLTAGAQFALLQTISWQAQSAVRDQAEEAIRETALAEYPNAVTARFDWSDDWEDQGPRLEGLYDAAGNKLEDSEELSELNDYVSVFDDYDTFRKSSAFEVEGDTGILQLRTAAPTVEQRIAAIDQELESAAPMRAAQQKREGELGIEALTIIAKDQFPDATAIFVWDAGDGDGSAYYEVARIENAVGDTLYDYDDGDDEEQAEAFAEYAPLLDRAEDKLEEAGTRGDRIWKLNI